MYVLGSKGTVRCLSLIAALVAGLILCGQPNPSVAHTMAKASPTNNCEEPLAYQPIEKPSRQRALKNKERNTGNPRNCRHQPTAQEPAYYDRWRLEKLRWPSNPNADACLDDSVIESKACPRRG
jgi:hypothetical protein